MASSRELAKRLQALEQTLKQKPRLVFCWTKNLADRIGEALGKRGITDATLVHLAFKTTQDEIDWETELRAVDRKEAARLDYLLAGWIP